MNIDILDKKMNECFEKLVSGGMWERYTYDGMIRYKESLTGERIRFKFQNREELNNKQKIVLINSGLSEESLRKIYGDIREG